ncbi:MAG: hypothetical protein VW080_04040, partial [Flavobacteriaceae bacterium]
MDSCVQTVKRLLNLFKVKHTFEYISDIVLSHPDHPSLLTIADTLNSLKIQTVAVTFDFKKLANMPLSCIPQIKRKKYTLSLFCSNKVNL